MFILSKSEHLFFEKTGDSNFNEFETLKIIQMANSTIC